MKAICKLALTTLTMTLMTVAPVLAFGPGGGHGRGAGPMNGGGMAGGPNPERPGIGTLIETLPVEDVDDAETADLVYMREEEKLARDLYTTFYEIYDYRVFERIAASEARHTEAIKAVLDRYGIADPITDDTPGVFADATLQTLYDQLLAQGSASLVDALTVGATVEDVDIADLMDGLTRTDNEDIRTVYQNLLKGSENHLRAFTSVLTAYGATYTPQYIDVAVYDEILAEPRRRGPVDADGEPRFDREDRLQMGPAGGRGRGIFCEPPMIDPDIPVDDAADDLLTRNGGGGGGHGPGDGSGRGGSGPRDGSGNGSRTGDCPYDAADAGLTPLVS